MGRLTVDGIRTALQTINASALKTREQTSLGSTIQFQRKQAFPSPECGTKSHVNWD